MFTEKFTHQINSLIQYKAEDLLENQRIASAVYDRRSGDMVSAFKQAINVKDMSLTLKYPLHVRFLDMKKYAKKNRKTRKQPLYNKLVYGTLYIGLYKKLSSGLSGIIVSEFKRSIDNE